MLARNWKHQWLPPCLARHAREARMGRLVARLIYDFKSKFACILEASESTRMRMEESLPNYHEDIAGKGDNSLKHCNLVHKFIPVHQAMKIPAAKAAVDKEWEKLENIPAWDTTEVRNKSEVIDEAMTKGTKVHFASLMDIYHLKNAELEAKHQKYNGRVVLRGDIVKDDSGSYAVFTEQGSSASQMTVAKVMDIISRLPGCSGHVNSTLHTSHFLALACAHFNVTSTLAQVWRAQRTFHIIACVIFMRSCCVFVSPRLSLPLLAVYLLSYRPVHLPYSQLLLPRCGGQIPCALSLMRTLAPLPSTTLSQVMSPTTTISRRPLNRTSRNPPARTGP